MCISTHTLYILLFRILDWKYFSLKIAQLSLASPDSENSVRFKRIFLHSLKKKNLLWIQNSSKILQHKSIYPLVEKICSAIIVALQLSYHKEMDQRICIFSITSDIGKLLFSVIFPIQLHQQYMGIAIVLYISQHFILQF